MSFSKPINFSFDSEEMNIIRSALGRMPHDDVQPIIVKIFQTVQDEVINKRSPIKQEEQQEAPYGYKIDGTPRARPGRKAKKVRK
jgi:hypothetical protein